jgi:hypothetical protein
MLENEEEILLIYRLLPEAHQADLLTLMKQIFADVSSERKPKSLVLSGSKSSKQVQE